MVAPSSRGPLKWAALMALRPLPRPSGDAVRRFLFEITAITIGILIALWIDEVRETRRDQSLVTNARALLRREIAGNLRDLEGTDTSREAHQVALGSGLEVVQSVLANENSGAAMPMFALNSPSFTRSAWDTANRTGAVALMDYDEVRAYTEVYDLQDLVDQTQQRYIQRLTEESAQLFVVMQNRLRVATRPGDVDQARVQVMGLLGAFTTYRDLCVQLVTRYKETPTL